MIRKITLINVDGRFRLQGQTMTKEDLCLLFGLHGYVIQAGVSSLEFYNIALSILAQIPEDMLHHSLDHLASMMPEDKVYYASMVSNKQAMVDFLGKN